MTLNKDAPRDLVMFGTGAFAETLDFYLTHDSPYRVVAFSSTRDNLKATEFRGRPVVPFEEVETVYPPANYAMFIAMGYRKLNGLRASFFDQARGKGYRLLSYVCSRATHWGDTKIGENVFIFEDNTIQPFVEIGDNSILWSGNHVGHHSRIGAHCFVSSHVVIAGFCRIGSHCFLGVNATISDSVSVGDRNVVGPGSRIQKDTGPDEVYLAEGTPKFPRSSKWFLR
jgi:sugar O-acyltransferase (sialic acid O-acetyltransferase NeuD family)